VADQIAQCEDGFQYWAMKHEGFSSTELSEIGE
jgi:hypothetical protein